MFSVLPSAKAKLLKCIPVLFFLLSAIGANSYWLYIAEAEQKTNIILLQTALLIASFVLVSFIAIRNQKQQQTKIEQRNQAQQILYDIAVSMNTSRDLRDLLNRFCDSTFKILKADNISVWLVTENYWLDYVANAGIDSEDSPNKRIKLDDGLISKLIRNRFIRNDSDLTRLAGVLHCNISEDDKTLYVPLQYQGRTLGLIRIKMDGSPFESRKDFEELIITLARHLSMAIEKARLDQETRRTIIMQERSLIANELHDSLAQTLASLRFQVRVLDETLQPTSEFKSIRGIEQVENSLDEAYSDLRELIAHCRTPINEKGLIPAIEKLISRFRKEAGTHVLLQKEWQDSDLPPNMEMHIFRIIQEAMNNIRKHSGANNVRIMLRSNKKGEHHILIENDGTGFEIPETSKHPGKHLGLTIMQERAAHLGGECRIESDPEEGTRIELHFIYNSESSDDPLERLSVIEATNDEQQQVI